MVSLFNFSPWEGNNIEKNRIDLYRNKVWGYEVSKHGLENGYLDYHTMSKLVGPCILNNTVRSETAEHWEMLTDDFDEAIYQDYIISEAGYYFLFDYTDEIVFYNENLDIYVWSITHFGTSWDYVLTNVKLILKEVK